MKQHFINVYIASTGTNAKIELLVNAVIERIQYLGIKATFFKQIPIFVKKKTVSCQVPSYIPQRFAFMTAVSCAV